MIDAVQRKDNSTSRWHNCIIFSYREKHICAIYNTDIYTPDTRNSVLFILFLWIKCSSLEMKMTLTYCILTYYWYLIRSVTCKDSASDIVLLSTTSAKINLKYVEVPASSVSSKVYCLFFYLEPTGPCCLWKSFRTI